MIAVRILAADEKTLEMPHVPRWNASKWLNTFTRKEAFRVNQSTHQKLARRKRRIERRLAARRRHDSPRPVLAARNIQYEVADREAAIGCGGIGAIHLLVRHVGLIDAIDAGVKMLKRHLPYHESDHVLSLAYNILAGGTCIEDLELRRSDEVFLDALGARAFPTPPPPGTSAAASRMSRRFWR